MALPVPFDANQMRRFLDPLHRDDEVLLFLVYAHVRCECVTRCHAGAIAKSRQQQLAEERLNPKP
jgi:hypothetical protein